MSEIESNTTASPSALPGHISDDAAGAPSSNVIKESGDWICGDDSCKNVNFERRTQCNKCHREKSVEKANSSAGGVSKKKLGTEIGKAAAEKSRGLFSAEDWQCSKCANVNWARRQTCNMCNAPKFCDVEERTGYGGGYNDRGVVEYKDRSESDSDYDEFGRLKKRTAKKFDGRNDRENNVDTRELAREYDDFDDEDDDEDDEDGDGDLSKYDLWGDDEVVNALKEKTENSRARSPNSQAKQSHSNSSSSHSRSTSSSSSSSTSTSKSNGEVNKIDKEKNSKSRSRSRNRSRDVSKTHSVASSKKSNRKYSKSRSRSRSSSKSDRRKASNQSNSHSSSSSSRGGRNSKTRVVKSKSRTRSRSSSRARHVSKSSYDDKRNNFSRSPDREKAVSSRYRRRSRSRSLSSSKRRR